MSTFMLIALGALVGANARYAISVWAVRHWGRHFPWGTLLINLSGGLLIGLVLGSLVGQPGVAPTATLLIVTGFLGAYTTYSTFSFELLTLLRGHAYHRALSYTAGSIIGSIAATALGLALTGLK